MRDALEVWLPVAGYVGLYEASNLGRVRRAAGAILQPTTEGNGYLTLCLSKSGRVTKFRLHRVILEAFCGPPPFEGAHGAHNDGDRSNCTLANLRWATPTENQADVARHGRRCRGEAVHCAVLSEGDVRAVRSRIAAGDRNRPIANDFGVSISTIHLIRHNQIWRHVA